jgi:4,5-dihydroxyphthalate decarboxylase
MRKFFHTDILVRSDASIVNPVDLRGKRVGVPEYQQTSAIWSRGILQHEFGVLPAEISWFMERNPDRSHGAATGFKPPSNVSVSLIPSHTNIGEMLLNDELDATLLYLNEKNLVDRSRADISATSKVRPLLSNPVAEGRRYYAKTGIFPINHVVVVRSSLLKQHPWLALNLFTAFVEARKHVEQIASAVWQPLLDSQLNGSLAEAIAVDPMPYGFVGAEPC